MSEQKGAYARGSLPGAEEIFRQLPGATEKLDRIHGLKIQHIAAGHVFRQVKKTIQHNIETKPIAPSTLFILYSLQAAVESNNSIIDQLFDEIERLKLQQ